MIISQPIVDHTPCKRNGCGTFMVELITHVIGMGGILVEPGIIGGRNTEGIIPVHLDHRRTAKGMVHDYVHDYRHALLMTGVHEPANVVSRSIHFVRGKVKIWVIAPTDRTFKVGERFYFDGVHT